jgi:hypothetical protein
LKTPSKHFFAEMGSVDFFNSSWTPNGKTAPATKTRIEDEFILSLIEDWLKKGSNIVFLGNLPEQGCSWAKFSLLFFYIFISTS